MPLQLKQLRKIACYKAMGLYMKLKLPLKRYYAYDYILTASNFYIFISPTYFLYIKMVRDFKNSRGMGADGPYHTPTPLSFFPLP